ncbi:unnamed protein product [Effrenium voratum]|nr:unnamed protein product [Effrenium voratum]
MDVTLSDTKVSKPSRIDGVAEPTSSDSLSVLTDIVTCILSSLGVPNPLRLLAKRKPVNVPNQREKTYVYLYGHCFKYQAYGLYGMDFTAFGREEATAKAAFVDSLAVGALESVLQIAVVISASVLNYHLISIILEVWYASLAKPKTVPMDEETGFAA